MNECICGVEESIKKLFGAVVVKYLEICEPCGTNVHIYDVYGYGQCVFHFSFIHVAMEQVMINFMTVLPLIHTDSVCAVEVSFSFLFTLHLVM